MSKEETLRNFGVSVSGLPGKMATLIATELAQRRLLVNESLTGPEIFFGAKAYIKPVVNNMEMPVDEVILYPPDEVPPIFKNHGGKLIIVDASLPDAVNKNAELYSTWGIPFVMLTTGGDRELLQKTVEASNVPAIIAPNMSVPVVVMMAAIRHISEEFPGALKDFDICIEESHQSAKKDLSGTARAMGQMFQKLGVNYSEQDIFPIRDKKQQLMLLGVPREHLGGHGHHDYFLSSQKGDVELGFRHNVNGRQTYLDGAMLALKFLAKKVMEGAKGEVYSMEDVLRG